MIKIIFWCPFVGNIGTPKAVIKSAKALNVDKKFQCFIINSIGEFDNYKSIFKKENIGEIKFFKNSFIDYLPKKGFFYSRFSFAIICLINFFPLLFFLKKNKNIIFIPYLLTSLPLLIFSLFNIKNKLFLKISGRVNYNFVRKFLYRISKNKIDQIFFQTNESREKFKKIFLFNNNRLNILRDPIIDKKEIENLKKKRIEKKLLKINYFISIGRLTQQKNFLFLLKCIKKLLSKNKKYKFIILGDGEQLSELKKYIRINNLEEYIYLLGHKKNVFKYIYNSQGLICSSLWEEPGFIIQEASACKKIILTSNCYSGPAEFLKFGKNGYIFKNNNLNSFIYNFKKMIKEKKLHKKKIENNFKEVNLYTEKTFVENFKKYLV